MNRTNNTAGSTNVIGFFLNITIVYTIGNNHLALCFLVATTGRCGKSANTYSSHHPTGNGGIVNAVFNVPVGQQIADKGCARRALALDGQVLHRTGQQIHQRRAGKAHRQSVALTVDLARERLRSFIPAIIGAAGNC